jgi:hypothetical protein
MVDSEFYMPFSCNNMLFIETFSCLASSITIFYYSFILVASAAVLSTRNGLPGGNMPAGFVLIFSTAKDGYDTLQQSFLNAGQNDEVQTQTKITANNDIHTKVMSMFLDGQEIYKDYEAVKKLFTFDQVLLTASGPGNTGVKGGAKNGVTNLPVEGATITFVGTGITTITDAYRKYQKIIASGTVTILVTHPDYQDFQITDFEIEAGIMKTLNIILVPLP